MSRRSMDEERPDIVAAARGGDHTQGMAGEADPTAASLEQARYWRGIYQEIVAMEDSVLERVRELLVHQSPDVRREVEETNVPVIAAQAAKFRARLGYWNARVGALE